MSALYGLYPAPDSAQRAVATLRSASAEMRFDPRQIVVVSQEPLENFAYAEEHAKSPMFLLAAVGGLLGGTIGYLLTSITQKSYPLPTGGMPLVPPWTNGIIVYEMIMLGAIIFTLATLLVTAHLPTFKKPLTDPEIWSGKILVGVTDPPENSRHQLEARLTQAGALAVKLTP